ncbi:MAG: heme biosynthesis protein HemY [Pseudazoarcus pumilus]|nr:heme biosynthesis protein HemY [Pseudazoarcus pumilus]
MRALIWILAIFAIAAGVAMLAGANEGYVLIVSPPWRAQVSLNLVIVVLLLSFFVSYALIRVLRKTLGLPGRVAHYRARRREQKASTALHNALRALAEGRMSDALTHVKAADAVDRSYEVALLGARAAHGLNDTRRCNEWLDKAERYDGRIPRLLAEAGFALERGALDTAVKALDALRDSGHRSVASRRLELELARRQGKWDEVAEAVRQLQSERAMPAEEARALLRAARLEAFRAKAGNDIEAAACWRDLPKEDVADPAMLAAVLPLLAQTGQGALARRAVERQLDEQWNSELARQYHLCAQGSDARDGLARAEKWLAAHPDDAGLLASLGRQCLTAQIWGKAQSYLEESLARAPRADVHMALAGLFEKLERPDDAAEQYRLAAKLRAA